MPANKEDLVISKVSESVSVGHHKDQLSTPSGDVLSHTAPTPSPVHEVSKSKYGIHRKLSSRSDQAERKEVEDNEACGIQMSCWNVQRRYRILFLQRLAIPKFAIALICTAYFFTEGIINGVFNVTITTVEKQFQLRTLEIGLIGGFMDLGAFIALTVSSYLGDKILKPVWMGWGVFVCGVGCIVFALPQFTSPSYSYGEEKLNYCRNVTTVECSESLLRNYKYAFMFATLLAGFGAQYIQTLGPPYIDENVKQVNSSLYTGIFFSFGSIGPALGYFVGGITLGLFNDPHRETHIKPSSSLWVGAWWISYVVGAVALLLFAFPVIILPRFLPHTRDVRENREQVQSSSKNHGGESEHFGHGLSRLAKNGTFVFLTLADCMNLAFIIGFMTYAIKIGEHLFGLSDSTSAYYMGACAIGASAAGYIIGGIVVTKLKLTLRGILLFMVGGSIVSFMFCFGLMFTCPEREFAGITLPYASENMTKGLSAECNTACGCNTDLFNPVCDQNGITYFSPCHAGCHTQVNESTFEGCLCVTSLNSSSVSREDCPTDACSSLTAVMLIMFVSFFSGFLIITPKSQATMRCVAFDERTAALSVQKIILILLGRLLGRMAFGEALELSCLTSSTDCGEEGACRAYMRKDMARNVTILFAAERFLCAVFCALAWIAYRRRKQSENVHEEVVRN